jgi:hypothetical protein
MSKLILMSGLIAGILLTSGCGSDTGRKGEEKSMVRGSTPLPSVLIFACDNGENYETRSQPYGTQEARFSLTLPRESVCRLWVKPGGAMLRSVTFSDWRGNLSSIIYLKTSRIDLGRIRTDACDALATIQNDDVLLVANRGENLDVEEAPSRFVEFQWSEEERPSDS